MAKKYQHSAYYYAYHHGWTHSDARTYVGKYLDMHTYRPRMRERANGEWNSKDWFKYQNSSKEFDSTFNPLLLLACAAVDIGIFMRDKVRKLMDPVERDRIKRELMRDLRRIRRPFYYAQEVERRRQMAIERRKINRRRTTAAMPTPEELLKAWDERKTSREAMIRLGGMIHDLECYVDNYLKIDENGKVVGRNRGIRGWLRDNIPELSPKYKTLMRYKALAVRLRQLTETKDPTPTSKLLKKPYHAAVEKILADEKPVFAQVYGVLEYMLAPETVLLDAPKKRNKVRNKVKKRSAVRREVKSKLRSKKE